MPVIITKPFLGTYYAVATRRMPFFLLFFLCCFSFLSSTAQDYNYVHYDTRDGLAGSTVYDLTQDKDGFLWFATDAGVSRFDGTRFKNFTTADGLPESEVLKLLADSKGRIWMAPFKNTLCYYYNGKIHTAGNDSLLKELQITAPIAMMFEDCEGSILFMVYNRKTMVLPGKDIGEANSFIPVPVAPALGISPNFSDRPGFIVITIKNEYIYYLHEKTQYIGTVDYDYNRYVTTNLFKDSTAFRAPKPAGMISINIATTPTYQRLLFVNTASGSWILDTLRLDRYEEQLLKGKQVCHAIIDREKNIWFATLGEGVYKLVSREFKDWHFKTGRMAEVFALEKDGPQVFAGMRLGWVYSVHDKRIDSINFNKYLSGSAEDVFPNRVTCLKKLRNGELMIGLDGKLIKKGRSGYFAKDIRPIKGIEEIDSSQLLVSTGYSALIVDQKDLSIKDTIWRYRTTAASLYNNYYYIGTTNGLLILSKNKSLRLNGDSIPCLSYRIGGFARSMDGTIWVATHGAGIVQMNGTRVVRNITTKDGLTSDLCRTLFIKDRYLWVGTDKGLSKIDLLNPGRPVISYSTLDGLPSNLINAIYVDSGKVYIGSSAGLTVFDEHKVFNSSRCDLQILDVTVSGQSLPIQKAYKLEYTKNNFQIGFVGISYKSGGNILYRYRLKGLKNEWDSTNQNVLEYPSLPSGDYQFEIMAINKFGVVSETISIPFLIETPFWQTWWFKLLVILLVIGMTALIVSFRFNVLRKREREKAELTQKVHDLEQLALRSQMNPHFIFNCLNSIQNFIIKNDLEATNQYLTEFAHLIRQTLDSSDKGVISIAQEVQYLTRYIELEQMRFGHSFSYTIEVEPEIDQDLVDIPSMILQPYIENAIRHGIRYKTGGQGMVRILFKQTKDALLCIVEDNGIGMTAARRMKSSMHVEYQSKGMSLTAARIDALNRQYQGAVSIEVIDLTDPGNESTGTQIIIRFPFKVLTKIS